LGTSLVCALTTIAACSSPQGSRNSERGAEAGEAVLSPDSGVDGAASDVGDSQYDSANNGSACLGTPGKCLVPACESCPPDCDACLSSLEVPVCINSQWTCLSSSLGDGGPAGAADVLPWASDATPSDGSQSANASHDGSMEGGVSCDGIWQCAPGQICCQNGCGACAADQAGCGRVELCAPPCTPVASRDSMCGAGKPPHFYRCILERIVPSRCLVLSIGNVTDTYCCP
jgi:hypothetical protein